MRSPKLARNARQTSIEAAARVLPKVGTQRRMVYEAIKRARGRGLTDEEGQARTRLAGDSYRPRRLELMELGLIASGTTRPTSSGGHAAVWVAKGGWRG